MLDISPDIIPFRLTFTQSKGKLIAHVHNAEETLVYDEVVIKGDSLFVTMSIFDSKIKAKIIDAQNIEGIYVRNYADNYVIPFSASKTKKADLRLRKRQRRIFRAGGKPFSSGSKL